MIFLFHIDIEGKFGWIIWGGGGGGGGYVDKGTKGMLTSPLKFSVDIHFVTYRFGQKN